jgi:hypothetical protein
VAFAPVSEKPLNSTAVLPVAVSVTVWAGLGVETFCAANVRLAGLMPRVIVWTWPVPLRGTDCGLPLALSVRTTFALREPAAVGLNVTVIEQTPPADSVAGLLGQVFVVMAKSPALVPETA